MALLNFRALAVGDAFTLDGRVYEKRSNYSAVLVRSESGESPSMKINRMINPNVTVERASQCVESE